MWRSIKQLSSPAAQRNELPALLDLSPARRVLVIAPHPDDETLGPGGTLARLAHSCDVHVLLVTNGDGGGELPPETGPDRKKEIAAAVRLLGLSNPVLHMDEPDGRFEDSPGFRSRLRDVVARLDPNWVFLPWLHDTHSDHSRIARGASEMLRKTAVDLLLYYETWTPVPATHVVDITGTIDVKRTALLCHETALRYGNYMNAILGLNAYRALYLRTLEQRWAEAFAVTGARKNRFL